MADTVGADLYLWHHNSTFLSTGVCWLALASFLHTFKKCKQIHLQMKCHKSGDKHYSSWTTCPMHNMAIIYAAWCLNTGWGHVSLFLKVVWYCCCWWACVGVLEAARSRRCCQYNWPYQFIPSAHTLLAQIGQDSRLFVTFPDKDEVLCYSFFFLNWAIGAADKRAWFIPLGASDQTIAFNTQSSATYYLITFQWRNKNIFTQHWEQRELLTFEFSRQKTNKSSENSNGTFWVIFKHYYFDDVLELEREGEMIID